MQEQFGRGVPCDCYALGRIAEVLSAYPGHVSDWISIGGTYIPLAHERLRDLFDRLSILWDVLPEEYLPKIQVVADALGRLGAILQSMKDPDAMRASLLKDAAESLANDIATSCEALAKDIRRICCK